MIFSTISLRINQVRQSLQLYNHIQGEEKVVRKWPEMPTT